MRKPNSNNQFLKDQQGSVLIFTVLMLGAMLSIALALAGIFLPKIRTAVNAGSSVSAIYAADSALEWCMYTNQGNPALPQPVMTNGAAYAIYRGDTVSTCPSGEGFGYRTVGTYQGVSRSLSVETQSNPGGTPSTFWTNVVGVQADANSLTKTAGVGWGNAGASSADSISSGDGYVEFTTNENNKYKLAGLSHGDGNQNYPEVDYAIDFGVGGDIYIFENGVNKVGQVGTYAAGDVFRISVVSGVVRYYKNNALLYTSNQTPVYPLILDTALYDASSTISTAKIFSGSQDVVWTNVVGVQANGNGLTKTAPNGWGNGGASSVQAIPSGVGYVEFSTNENDHGKVVGLNHGDPDQDYVSTDYGINLTLDGHISIYENGTLAAYQVSTYVAGDIFKVSVESGVIKYYKNGGLLYTSGQAPVYPLVLDAALKLTGGTITNARISY